MTLRINHNVPMVNAHRNVFKKNSGLKKSYERISAGLRIVRAADGPASLIISEQMRSQIRGIEQAIRNSESGIAMMQTTESSLNEVNRMLTEIRSLAVHAANDAVNDELMLRADQQEVDNILNALDRVARNTSFGNRKILDGTAGAKGVATGEGLEFINATKRTKSTGEQGYEVRITRVSTQSGKVGTANLTDEIVQNGERLTIIDNGKQAAVVGTKEDTSETLVTRLQKEADNAGLNVDIKLINNKLAVHHREYGSETRLAVYSDTDRILSEKGGKMEVATHGLDIRGYINEEVTIGKGRVLTSMEGNPTSEGLSVRYTGNIGTRNGEKVDSEKGIPIGRVHVSQNSLRFQLGDNYAQNESISIAGMFSSELGKGIDNGSEFRSLRDIDVTSFERANDTLRLISSAIEKVSLNRGNLGAFQKNLLEANLNSMMVMRENMISSESAIRDADMAEEMTQLTKNQMLQQSAMSIMSYASQDSKNVLQLIQ